MYDANRIYEIPISKIYADEDFNCRGHITALDVNDLATDIANRGLDQPIQVEPYNLVEGKDFRIITGHRRFKATEVIYASGDKIPGTADGTIKATIKEGLDDLQRLVMNFNENTQRQQLNLKQESKAIEKFVNLGLSRNDIAAKIGMGSTWVQIRTYFCQFPERVQDILVAHNVKQHEVREFYKTFQDCPIGPDGQKNFETFFEQVRRYKETGSVQAGKSAKRAASEKRIRTKPEMIELIKHIRDNGMGAGILTRLLAHCAGEVSLGEIDKELEEWHRDYGFEYTRLHEDGT